MLFKPVIIPMSKWSITGTVYINRNNINLATVLIFSANKCDIASNGVVFYASLAPDEVITALNNLASSTSNMAFPHGSDIYTGAGYFEETFPNATGAISGIYENNAMLIQLYYDNITFKIAVKGSNGLSYGIPVSNTSVVYFIPHHINETSEMTLIMFYVGVQYYLVHHQPLYRNVNEGTLGISASENAETYGNIAGGSFVPYIVCCHPGDCACSGSGDQSWSGSSCKWYNYDSYNCEQSDTFQISATICYDSSGVITGVLNTQTYVQELTEGPCCDLEGANGQVSLNVPQLS